MAQKQATYGTFSSEDCLFLLTYVAREHPVCTITELAEGVGIPRQTLNLILIDALSNGRNSQLAVVAERHHYEYKINKQALIPGLQPHGPKGRRMIIDAEWRGYQ